MSNSRVKSRAIIDTRILTPHKQEQESDRAVDDSFDRKEGDPSGLHLLQQRKALLKHSSYVTGKAVCHQEGENHPQQGKGLKDQASLITTENPSGDQQEKEPIQAVHPVHS
jgi:hypothetical protein